ncbi:MAG: hypothetical protein HC933_15650 [Pleurocapsa sp. SU_196_0]|nr:hypothetical protein [Pleurocapsa sp. SU_196_0]
MTTMTDRRSLEPRFGKARFVSAPVHLIVSATASSIIGLRTQQIWQRLSDPRSFGAFLSHLDHVRQIALDEYDWRLRGCVEIAPIRFFVREPPTHLAWQSMHHRDKRTALQIVGELRLEALGWQTRLRLRLNYVCQDATLSDTLRTTLHDLPAQLEADLIAMHDRLKAPLCDPS